MLGIAINCNAQYYFNNEYAKLPWTNDWGRSIVKHDSIYSIIAGYGKAGVQDIGLLKINKNGDVVNETGIGNNYFHVGLYAGWSNNIVLLNDGAIVGSGSRNDSFTTHPIIVKFKPNGDTAWYHIFTNVGTATTGQQLRGTADGGFLLAGEQYLQNSSFAPTKIILIKTDSMGNYLWHKTYDNPPGFQNRIASFMKKDDNTFMIGHIYQTTTGGWSAGQVFAIDSIGNVKWRHQYNKPKDVGGMQVTPSNYIIGYYTTGFYDTIMYNWQSPSNNYVNYIARVDTSSKTIWRIWDVNNNNNEQKAFWYIKEIGGYIYTIGNVRDSSRNFVSSGMFCKIDSLGNLKWMQRYHAYKQTADSYLSDFVQTDDGGFMLCGSGFDSTNHQSVWVVRVDSNGCEVANCLLDTSVGFNTVSIFSNAIELQVYPNPAHNKLLVMSDGLLVEIEVYDVYGRIMNPPLQSSNQQIELDISNLASGIYFVKAIHRSGQVSKKGSPRRIKTAKFVKQ
jgi:hypothetical protein